jgi:hypothetical protein
MLKPKCSFSIICNGKSLICVETMKCKLSKQLFSLIYPQYLSKASMSPPIDLKLLQEPPLKISLFHSFQITHVTAPLTISHILSSLNGI